MDTTQIALPPYHMIRLGSLVEEFQNEATHFTQLMLVGPGIRSNSILDLIRKLEQLYINIGCHLDVASSTAGKTISLEDGLNALEAARQADTSNKQIEE